MKKQLILIFLIFCSCLFAQDLSFIPGVFLDIGYGARPTGMGGAYTAAANDVYSLIWNPAGLTHIKNQQASFFYTKQYSLIPYTMAAYSNGFGESKWKHGEAVLVSGDDALRETVIYFGVGYNADQFLKNLSFGMNLKYKNASFGKNQDGGEGQITGNALGLGIDFGALYKMQDKITTGIVVKNLFDMVSWNSSSMGNYTQNNPLRVVAGFGFFVSEHHIIAVDFEKSLHLDTMDRLNIGTERTFFNILNVRGGAFQNLEPSATINYNLGFGVLYSQLGMGLKLDAAYVIQEINNSLKLSLTLDF